MRECLNQDRAVLAQVSPPELDPSKPRVADSSAEGPSAFEVPEIPQGKGAGPLVGLSPGNCSVFPFLAFHPSQMGIPQARSGVGSGLESHLSRHKPPSAGGTKEIEPRKEERLKWGGSAEKH